MNPEYDHWFLMAVVLGVEYGLKEFFELLPNPVVKAKKIYWFYRLVHWMVLTILLGLLFATPHPWFIWPIYALLASILGSVELIAYYCEKKLRKFFQQKSYLFQFPLFFAIGWLAFKSASIIDCRPGGLSTGLINYIQVHFIKGTAVNGDKILAVGTVVILLAYPVNYVIRWLISISSDQTLPGLISLSPAVIVETVKNSSKNTDISLGANFTVVETIRAGRIIGVLERWLIFILILCGQFAGIGLVLTAKSIARFKDFDKNNFAEYYLVGTLYSTLFAVVASLMFLN